MKKLNLRTFIKSYNIFLCLLLKYHFISFLFDIYFIQKYYVILMSYNLQNHYLKKINTPKEHKNINQNINQIKSNLLPSFRKLQQTIINNEYDKNLMNYARNSKSIKKTNNLHDDTYLQRSNKQKLSMTRSLFDKQQIRNQDAPYFVSKYQSQQNSVEKQQYGNSVVYPYSTAVKNVNNIKKEKSLELVAPFQVSFLKMQQIKEEFIINNVQLTQEVNDIVDLIKGQRVRTKIIYEQLYLQLEQLEKQPISNQKLDKGTNTEQMIIQSCESSSYDKKKPDTITKSSNSQSSGQKNIQKMERKLNQPAKKAYTKLQNMLLQSKINPDMILPKINSQNQKVDDKEDHKLTSEGIIQLQQALIKKLTNCLPKPEKQSRSSENTQINKVNI